jgi:hypothetical protein
MTGVRLDRTGAKLTSTQIDLTINERINMGTWGAALYDDDSASDLRDTIASVCKVPVSGDRLLGILKEMQGECDPTDEDGALFWLVVADQFEKRRIECREASAMALDIIDRGLNLEHAREAGADERFLKKRAAVLQQLAERLRVPRPVRPRVGPRKPPPLVLGTGEIYAFQTMKGRAWHPYRLRCEGPFAPDGWGAMVVLATGRAFDWVPWVSLASLELNEQRKPTLGEALAARLMLQVETDGAGRYIPKRSHARGMNLELLGRVELDSALVEPILSTWRLSRAVRCDWSVCLAGFGAKFTGNPRGPLLSSLLVS